MKLITAFMLALAFTVTAIAQDLPSAQQIFDKAMSARGGVDAINTIKDMTISMTSSSERGFAETEVIHAFPEYKGAMSVYSNGREVMGMKYNGDKYSRSSPFGGGAAPLSGDEAMSAGLQMNPFAEMNYEKMGYTATVDGIEKVNDKDAYKVTLTKNGKSFTNFYDVSSGLKVKSVTKNTTPRGDFESTSMYENYEKFKGSEVLFPKVTKQSSSSSRGSMETSSEISGIKFNKGVKDKVFQID